MDTSWKQKTIQDLQEIFREQFLDDRLVVTDQTSPADIEEWDSLAHVNLLVAIEATFGVRFTADEMGSIDGVPALLEVLDAKRSLAG